MLYMKNSKHLWISIISFLIGALICYITLQYKYFEIKKELDIPTLLISIVTLAIGGYIADNLQKSANKSSNRYSYLITKIDIIWDEFNKFASSLEYNNTVDADSLKNFNKNVIHPISFIKNIFKSFDLKDNCICELEDKLDQLDTLLNNLEVQNNTINHSSRQSEIQIMILQINQCFSTTLKMI